MTRRVWIGLVAVALLVGGGMAVVRILRPSGVPAGMLAVEWRGSFRGQALLPAQLQWCPITRLGTLEAISNDTGILVSLRERDTLSTGVHPVFSPDLGGDLPLPAAAASFRWVRDGDSAIILGFKGMSGAVDVERVGGTASGSLDIQMQRAFRADTIRIRGNFHNIPVVATAVGCP